MPRARRHYLPGHIWHLTHRCHRKQFLLKLLKDRRIWMDLVYEVRGRFRLSVLDYNVTSNHIHLIVRDRGRGEIARSMKLIAVRTGQQFNVGNCKDTHSTVEKKESIYLLAYRCVDRPCPTHFKLGVR